MFEHRLARPVPTALALRQEIARVRQELTRTAGALKRQLAEKARPSSWVRRHPYAVLAGAFAIGFYLGARK